MKVNEMIPSKFLKADDLDGDVTVTIDRLANEEVGKEGEHRWVLYFREKPKGLVANVTNLRALEAAYGDESDDWIGESITLFTMPVQYAGRTFQGVRERARKWLKRDVIPIPVPHASKAPAIPGWQNLRPTEEDLPQLFSTLCNIGILLGDVSGGLLDIDLDCDEAVATAALFFPDTPTFGRKSRPESHLIYICSGIETRKFSHDGMIVEIRSTGCQTIAPGSTHPSGEIIEQYRKGAIASITPEELIGTAERTAAAALLAKQWKANNGSRHEATLALAGALTGARWSDDEIVTFVRLVTTRKLMTGCAQ